LKKAELLSPAGNFEKLKIALSYGADAVYGGVSHFSLRVRASKEFDYDTFKDGIDYVHSKNKKIYTTINGFPFNSQIKLLGNHIEKIAKMNPDALIVSTPGVIKLAKKIAPHIPLHLSTQANVLNYLDAEFYYDAGVSRIITAREISLKDLKSIKEHIPNLELEVFVHGSMCFAYSGRCLISSLQSGRVPNRGSCANDCRFPYELYAKNEDSNTLFKLEEEGEGTYIMNAKDLNLASNIDEILDSGVIDSLKIEGRTKSPYYTAITAKTYRKAIDDYYNKNFNPEEYQTELHSTMNRGFTDGYLVNRPYKKFDSQNLDSALSGDGTHQVVGLVDKSENHFMCKFKTLPNDEIEIVTPDNRELKLIDNDIGKIIKKEDRYFLTLHKILTQNGKELEAVHSGNINPIQLPIQLPELTFFRIKIK